MALFNSVGKGNESAKNQEEITKQSDKKSRPDQSIQGIPIVGIGASAGGLEPIRKILETLPPNLGIALVVIQHMATGQESMLPEILSRSTKMTVHQIKDNMQIEPNNVYVIKPGTNLSLKNNYLKTSPKNTNIKSINQFFISLASEKKASALGIILSGTGDDGTEGLKEIKVQGGITFAQDPEMAQYPDMPRNAINADTVYFVCSPENIANELINIVKHPQLFVADKKPLEEAKEESDQKKILRLLRNTFGVDFTHYKEATITRRIARRMVLKKVENLKEFAEYLRTHTDELQILFDDLLIGVTEFFREPNTFALFKERVCPELFKNRLPNQSVRIWVPGCSSGEEVYSFAITMLEYIEENAITGAGIQFFGTDISEKNVEKARQGTYLKAIENKVSKKRLTRFFTSFNGNYQIAKFIREMCIFAKQDLTVDPPFSKVDLVICRNLLIYFDSHLKERIVPLFHYALKPNGFLVLSGSEGIGEFQYLFEPIDKKGLIYKSKRAQPQVALNLETFVPYAAKTAVMQPQKTDLTSKLKEEIDNVLIAEYVPAALIINSKLDVLFFRGQVNPYLIHESGAASLNITKIVQKELRAEVQSAIYMAKKESKIVKTAITLKRGEHTKTVQIQVKPLKTLEYDESFFIVTFGEHVSNDMPLPLETKPGIKPSKEDLKDRQIRELREDLESNKQSLQNVVEAHEATNEELRSAMEEVQSSNEELQSTNEELETAKEELQSSNEELQTLNEELKNRNQTLIRLNDDLNNLQNNMDAAIVIVDNDITIRRITESAQKLLGILPHDIGRPLTKINLGLKVEGLGKLLSKVISKLSPVSKDVAGDEGRWFELRILPYLSEEKKIDGAVLSFVEITERKKIEEALGKSEKQLRAYVTASSDAVYSMNSDWSEMRQLHGKNFIPDTNEPNRSWMEKYIHPDDRQRVMAVIKHVVKTKGIFELEYRLIRIDGTLGWTFSRAVPLLDKDDKIIEWFGTAKDITERKKAEEKLAEYQNNLEQLVADRTKKLEQSTVYNRNLIEASLDPLVTISKEGKITDVNKATEDVTGCIREQLIGSDFSNYFTEPNEASAIYRKVFTEGLVKDYPLEIRNKSGKVTKVLYNASTYRNPQGQVQGVFAAARDVTELKKAEEMALEASKKLKDSERLAAIGATAGMVGHDIRNPLQAITSDVYLAKTELASTPESEEKKNALDSLQEIETNVDYINKIVQDLQDYARPLNPNPGEADLKLIIDKLLEKNHLPENIKVSVKVEPEARRVGADNDYLTRIFYNLVTNAVQAMPKGGQLTIHVCKEANSTVIAVKDTGVGIPKKIQEKMFTPMFTTKSKGQGFGLPVVKRMTESLGGNVSFESEEGKGTTFIVRLPPQKS